jgi:hypothetical protein
MLKLYFDGNTTEYTKFKSVAGALDPHGRGQLFYFTFTWTDVNSVQQTAYVFDLVVDNFYFLNGNTPQVLPAFGAELLALYPSAVHCDVASQIPTPV